MQGEKTIQNLHNDGYVVNEHTGITKKEEEPNVKQNDDGMKFNGKLSALGPISNSDKIRNFMKSIKFDEAEKNRSQQKHQQTEFHFGIKHHLDEILLSNESKQQHLTFLLKQLISNDQEFIDQTCSNMNEIILHQVKEIENEDETLIGEEEKYNGSEEEFVNGIQQNQFDDPKATTIYGSRFADQNQLSSYAKSYSKFLQKQKGEWSGYLGMLSQLNSDQSSKIIQKEQSRLVEIKSILEQVQTRQQEEVFLSQSLSFLQKRTETYIMEYQKKLLNMDIINEAIEKTSESMNGELNSVCIETKVIHFKKERIKDEITGKDKKYFETLNGKEIIQIENEKDLLEMIKKFEIEQNFHNSLKSTLKQQEKEISILEKQQKHKHKLQNQQNSKANLIDRLDELIQINEFLQKIDKEQFNEQEDIQCKQRSNNFEELEEMEEQFDGDSFKKLQGRNIDEQSPNHLQVEDYGTLNNQKREKPTNMNSSRQSLLSIQTSERQISNIQRRKSKLNTLVIQKQFQSSEKSHHTKNQKTQKIINFLETIAENISGFFDNLVDHHKNLQITLDDLQIRQTMLRELKNDRLKELNELLAIPVDKTEVQLFKNKGNSCVSLESDSAEAKLRCQLINEANLEDVKEYKQQLANHQKLNVDEIYIFERTSELYSLNKVQVIILFTSQNLKNIHYRMVRALGSLGDHSYLSQSAQINELYNRAATALNSFNERAKIIFERDFERIRSELYSNQLVQISMEDYQIKQLVEAMIGELNIFKSILAILKFFFPCAPDSIKFFVEEFKFGFHLLRFCKKSDLVEFCIRTYQSIMIANKQQFGSLQPNQKINLPLQVGQIENQIKEKIVFTGIMENFSLLVEKSVSSVFSIIMDRIMMIVSLTKSLNQNMQNIFNPISGTPIISERSSSKDQREEHSPQRYLDFNFGSSAQNRVYSPFLPLLKYSKSQISKLNFQKGVAKYEKTESLTSIDYRNQIVKKNPLLMNISEIVKEQMCMLHYQNSPSIINLAEEYTNFDDLRSNVKSQLKSIENSVRKKLDKSRQLEEKRKHYGKKTNKSSQFQQSDFQESILSVDPEINSVNPPNSNIISKDNPIHNSALGIQNNSSVIKYQRGTSQEIIPQFDEQLTEEVKQDNFNEEQSSFIPIEQETKNESPSGSKVNKFKMMANLTKTLRLWNSKIPEEGNSTAAGISNEPIVVNNDDPQDEPNLPPTEFIVNLKQKPKRKLQDPQRAEFINELKQIVHYQMDYKNAKKKGIEQHFSEFNTSKNNNKAKDPQAKQQNNLLNGANNKGQDDNYQQNYGQPPQIAPAIGNPVQQGLSKVVSGEKTKIKKAFAGYFRKKQYEQYKEIELKLGTIFKHSGKLYSQKIQDNQNLTLDEGKFREMKSDNSNAQFNGDILPDMRRSSSGHFHSNKVIRVQRSPINGIIVHNSNSDDDSPRISSKNKLASQKQLAQNHRVSIFDKNDDGKRHPLKPLEEIKSIKFNNNKQYQKQSSLKSPDISSSTQKSAQNRSTSPNGLNRQNKHILPQISPPSSAKSGTRGSPKKGSNEDIQLNVVSSTQQNNFPR